MKLTDLQEQWAVDCKIDTLDVIKESARVPVLHSRYINHLSNARLVYRKLESDYLNLRNAKFRYYRGEMTKPELEQWGWDQWKGNKPLKSEMGEFLESDADMVKMQDKLEYQKTILLFLEQVIKSINSRTWDIKNIIEWTKFSNGN